MRRAQPAAYQRPIRSDMARLIPRDGHYLHSDFTCPIFLGHLEARGRCSQGERVPFWEGTQRF